MSEAASSPASGRLSYNRTCTVFFFFFFWLLRAGHGVYLCRVNEPFNNKERGTTTTTTTKAKATREPRGLEDMMAVAPFRLSAGPIKRNGKQQRQQLEELRPTTNYKNTTNVYCCWTRCCVSSSDTHFSARTLEVCPTAYRRPAFFLFD